MTTSVYIAKNVYGGDGIGRLGDGRVVFVPGAFAGEHVKAEIESEKKNYVKARLAAVEDASPERTGEGAPPQPGMVYANLTAKGECEAKAAQIAEFFSRARIAVPEGAFREKPLAGGDEAGMLNYRNKVVYHIGRGAKGCVIGYRLEPGHEVVDIERDLLARPEINAKLPEIRRNVLLMLTNGARSVRRSVEGKSDVTIRWSQRSGVQWWLGEAPAGLVVKESVCGRGFDVPADGFWQVNPAGGEALVRAVSGACAGAERVLDLYCGVGVLGLSCGAARLLGVESGDAATGFARRNAAALGAKDATFLAGRAAALLKRIKLQGETTVIVDPPRGGMERAVAEWLAAAGRGPVRRIVYASCDPATMMRDLAILSRSFAVESVCWINMFPRTARFETLAVLKALG